MSISSETKRQQLGTARVAISRYANSSILLTILELVESNMVDISKLQSDVTALQQAGQAAATELGDLVTQVQQLQEAGADNITQADIDSLVSSVEGVTSSLTAAVGTASAPPATPATPATPAAPVTGPPNPTPGTPTPVTPPTSTGTASLPLYTYTGTDAPDSNWTLAQVETTDDPPQPLYTFSGDSPGGTPTGQSPEWHVYTGGTQPVPTPSDGGATPATPTPAPAPSGQERAQPKEVPETNVPSDVPAGGAAPAEPVTPAKPSGPRPAGTQPPETPWGGGGQVSPGG